MEKEKIKCPRCDSSLVYIRIKTGELVCRSCNFIEPLDKNKKEENEN